MVTWTLKPPALWELPFTDTRRHRGLGARITETWFTKQFAGCRSSLWRGDKKIFFLKPAGPGKGPNELDAITGATGTSRAVEAFVNRDLDRFLREMWKQVKKG